VILRVVDRLDRWVRVAFTDVLELTVAGRREEDFEAGCACEFEGEEAYAAGSWRV
jgi:hypothetical protein